MATATPAVSLDSFLKASKERKELEKKLREITVLKADKDRIEKRLREELVPEIASALIGYGHKKVEFEGFTHFVFEGTNVSVSMNDLKNVMMRKGVDPDLAQEILRESTKKTAYTTIMTTPVREKAVAGGITGSA